MHPIAAIPPCAHGLLLGTVGIWVVLELRQGVNHRPEGVKASWGSEIVFRLAIVIGALVAIVFSRVAPAAAILLAVVGLGLFIGNWLSLVSLTIAVACGLVFRIRVEERALPQNLGDDYRSYAATRKRLVPFIW